MNSSTESLNNPRNPLASKGPLGRTNNSEHQHKAKGFNCNIPSPKQRVLHILRSDYFLKNGQYLDYVEKQRQMEFRNHIGSEPVAPSTLDELFLPCDDRYIPSLDITTTPGGNPVRTLFNGTKGFWKLNVLRSSVNDLTDFTISVLVGNKWRHYPAAIKKMIVKDFGLDVYCKWRSAVLGDIDSLRQLIAAAKFDGYAYSVTSCVSSERLCKRAGLEVKNKIAFLLPN
jgi:hypothetical protein